MVGDRLYRLGGEPRHRGCSVVGDLGEPTLALFETAFPAYVSFGGRTVSRETPCLSGADVAGFQPVYHKCHPDRPRWRAGTERRGADNRFNRWAISPEERPKEWGAATSMKPGHTKGSEARVKVPVRGVIGEQVKPRSVDRR